MVSADLHRMVVTIYDVTRLQNSVNGNARFTLFTDGGNYNTAVDSACAQDVKNILSKLPIRKTLYINRGKNVVRIGEA